MLALLPTVDDRQEKIAKPLQMAGAASLLLASLALLSTVLYSNAANRDFNQLMEFGEAAAVASEP